MFNQNIKSFDRMTSSDRRSFLRATVGGVSALSSPVLMSTLMNLQAAGSVVADAGSTSGYHAFVCFFLLGGKRLL